MVAGTYVPPPPNATGTGNGGERPALGKWWPLDRKVWSAGIVTGLVMTALSYFHYYTGIDLNVLNPIVGLVWPFIPGLAAVAQPDVTALLSLAIGAAVAQYLPPSLHDGVAWLNAAVIRAANAAPEEISPVKAMIVDAHTSEAVARQDIAAGAVPADIVAKRDG